MTHSSGQFLSLTYNGAGLISSITDSAGRTTTYHYDPTNQYLTSVVDFDGETTSYTYDQGNNPATEHALLSVTHSDGTHDYFTYDAQGCLADAHRDGGAEDTTFAYREGQVGVTDALGDTTRYFFDNRGLLVQVENPLQNTVHYTYDSNLNLIQTTDAAGQVYTNTYDAYGNILSTTDPLGHTVTYTYNCNEDTLASVTDGNGNTTLYAYDGKGNLTSTTYADGTVESVAYDPIGNVIRSTDQMGQVTKYTHDAAGSILTETFADGSETVFTYDAHENLTSATDSTGTTALTYDANDRLIQITYPSGHYLKYAYDAAGRRTQMVDDTGFKVNYRYDEVGNLATLTDGSGNLIVRYTYDAAGRLIREDHGNGTYVTYQYDAAGELLHLVNFAPSGSINSRFDYTYDSLGQRINEATLDGTWTYTYDAIGELTHAVFVSTNPTIANQDLAYSYDAAGNRTQTIINGVTTAYTTNNMNEYTQVGDTTYTYNADGDMTSATDSGGSTSYTYNVQNQLVGVTGSSGSWAYQYDALGGRIAATQSGQITQYLIDPAGVGTVEAVFIGTNILVAHYTFGLKLVSQIGTSNMTLYYDYNAAGSTVGLTSASGKYVETYSYTPFGQTLATSGNIANQFQFIGSSGVQTDPTGLVFMRTRDFQIELGRFIQFDPLRLASGDVNVYRYASNNPINSSDPTGESSLFDVLKLSWDSISGISNTLEIYEVAVSGLVGAGIGSAVGGIAGVLLGGSVGFVGGIAVGVVTLDPLAPVVGLFGGALLGGYAGYVSGASLGFGIGSGYEVFRLAEGKIDFFIKFYDYIHSLIIYLAGSFDPNSKYGPVGYGTENFVSLDGSFPYRIDFENATTATAPAQRVDVTDQLDPNLDWSTFQWTGFGFGNTFIAIPPNTQHYETTLPMTYNGVTFRVVITLDLDPETGMVHVSFQSLNAANLMTGPAQCPGTLSLGPTNPEAELPPPVTIGFLPPEDGTGRGMGYVTYTVKPKSDLTTGTPIRNVADVKFDLGTTIATDQVSETDPTQGVDKNKQDLVTIDSVPPTSSVAALPTVSNTTEFNVSWSGQDDFGGSGVASYSIYVSDNGGAYTPWLTNTTQTSATYTGLDGHTYGFYSIATDNVGNAQFTPTAAQATTTVNTAPRAPSITGSPSSQTGTAGANVSLTSSAGGNPTPTVQWQISTDGGKTWSNINGATSTSLTLNNVAASQNGDEFRAVYTNSLGTATSAAATLTVQLAPTVTTNPSNETVTEGLNATFTASANGNPTPTIQWQVSSDGGKTFSNITGDNSATLSLSNVTRAMSGNRYQAVFGNSIGNVSTSAATLTVTSAVAPVISTNPSNLSITVGQSAIFTASASSSPSPTVQWQVSTDGGKTFTNISGATNTSLTLSNATAAMSGNEYRAAFTNSAGTVPTSFATLIVHIPMPPPPPSPPPPPPPIPTSPPPFQPPTLLTPPLLAFLDGLLGGVETVIPHESETVIDSLLGFSLLISTYDSSGNLVSVALLGMNVTFLFG